MSSPSTRFAVQAKLCRDVDLNPVDLILVTLIQFAQISMDLNAVDLIIVDTIPTVTGDAIDFKQEREKRAEMAHRHVWPNLPVSPFPV